MILDNSINTKKVINWFQNETPDNIKFNIVTGYFTIGALQKFIQIINDKSNEINLIVGDMLLDDVIENPIDLLNQDISLSTAFSLPDKAKDVIKFLKDKKVNVKMLEPNFCHAKVYLAVNDQSVTKGYFVTGSSNLTESGLGMKFNHNIELNIAGQPTDPQHNELTSWFDNLWLDQKTKQEIIRDGKIINVKDYLIQLIESFSRQYSPEEIYFKILYELFKNQISDKDSPEFLKEIGRLEDSKVYQELYEFQQKGVISLIKMLNKYNGAILADGVGLGKTWSALATIKYFQNKGYQTILLVPKKLHQNWQHYQIHHESIFQDDKFDYVIRFHTDLQDERIESKHDGLKLDSFFQSNKPKLFVIDESHNLRNNKSNRYKYLTDYLLNLQKNPNHKVLLLSATPINTSFNDLRNQFKLLVSNKNDGFKEYFDINNIDSVFNTAQAKYNEWRSTGDSTIQDLIQLLPDAFTKLADHLIIARTRKIITGLKFPKPEKPINKYVTPEEIGTVETFEELFKKFPPHLAVYSPYLYLKKDETENVDVLNDEWQRDAFLVKMMYILLVKRLESSWKAFYITLQKISDKTEAAFDAVKEYEAGKKSAKIKDDGDEYDEEEDDEYTLGKREIKISDIDADGLLPRFKKHLKEDIAVIRQLIDDLKSFEKQVNKEVGLTSKDRKLEVLISEINKKQKEGKNNKVLIFTSYRDTAYYLYEELTKRGLAKLAVVTGQDSKHYLSKESQNKFEPILERFCPYIKLFIEKKWTDFEKLHGKKELKNFDKWKKWIKENDEKTNLKLNQEIDILIATDCLSEGQNLQDCDYVVNYDIHWNPVRIIQRIGRVDRIGSPNNSFKVLNFWPTDNINTYLSLEDRIVNRLVAARLAGAEFNPELVKKLTNKLIDDNTDEEQKRKLLEQMSQNIEDLNDSKSFGFSDLTLDTFRQDLLSSIDKNKNQYAKIPKGSFSGFVSVNKELCPKEGLIALLGYISKRNNASHIYNNYKLVYLDNNGKLINDSQLQNLSALATHYKEPRNVPKELDSRIAKEIEKYQEILFKYFENINNKETKEGKAESKKMIKMLKSGNKDLIKLSKEDGSLDELNNKDNYELLAWMIIQ
jgi:superfamily II DNA/RNA helicase